MKRLMVIGGSVLQLPAVIKAKEMGYTVAVADYDSNAIAIPYADKFYNASTIDQTAIIEAAKDFDPDGIITLASDMPMRSVAAACKQLGLIAISPETALKATDKGEMIKCFKQNDVASPWFFICANEVEFQNALKSVDYPCIMKPLDNAGSRGVVLANNEQELKDGYEYSSSNSRGAGVIIEEYMTGNEVSVEVMTLDKKSVVLAITDKLTTGAPHFVEMGHSQQTQLDEQTKQKIEILAKKAVAAIGIDNGPAHVEIMVTKNGPKMIELGARMGGDCITTHLVPLSTGVDMMRATIEIACGIKPDLTPKVAHGSAIRFFKAKPGVIKAINNVELARKIDGVSEIVLTKKVDEKSVEINSSVDRIGYVIACAENAEQAVKLSEKAVEMVEIIVE